MVVIVPMFALMAVAVILVTGLRVRASGCVSCRHFKFFLIMATLAVMMFIVTAVVVAFCIAMTVRFVGPCFRIVVVVAGRTCRQCEYGHRGQIYIFHMYGSEIDVNLKGYGSDKFLNCLVFI